MISFRLSSNLRFRTSLPRCRSTQVLTCVMDLPWFTKIVCTRNLVWCVLQCHCCFSSIPIKFKMPSTLSSPKAPCEKANGWNNSHGRGPQDSAMKSLASSSGSFALSILKQIGIIGSIRLANGFKMLQILLRKASGPSDHSRLLQSSHFLF